MFWVFANLRETLQQQQASTTNCSDTLRCVTFSRPSRSGILSEDILILLSNASHRHSTCDLRYASDFDSATGDLAGARHLAATAAVVDVVRNCQHRLQLSRSRATASPSRRAPLCDTRDPVSLGWRGRIAEDFTTPPALEQRMRSWRSCHVFRDDCQYRCARLASSKLCARLNDLDGSDWPAGSRTCIPQSRPEQGRRRPHLLRLWLIHWK